MFFLMPRRAFGELNMLGYAKYGIEPYLTKYRIRDKIELRKECFIMAQTVSMSYGKIAIEHDVRINISPNIDATLSGNNESFIDKLKDYNYSLEEYTNARFQPIIDEYNNKQKREDRKKNISYVDIVKAENEKLLAKAKDNKEKGIKKSVRPPTKLAYEYVLQVGNRDTNGTKNASSEDIACNREYCRKVLEDFQEKYPHAEVLLATFHADEPEGTPHMHLLIQFVGENYKQGLRQQISMSKALELDGFERAEAQKDYAINRFCDNVKDTIMTENLEEYFNEKRKFLNEKRKRDDTPIFRIKAKKEAAALDEKRTEIKNIEKENEHLIKAKHDQVKQDRALNNIQPESGLFGTLKNITIKQINWLKKQAQETFKWRGIALDYKKKYEKEYQKHQDLKEKMPSFIEIAQLKRAKQILDYIPLEVQKKYVPFLGKDKNKTKERER